MNLKEATVALDTAILGVAQSASELSSEAERRGDVYRVDAEYMDDLREALKEWRKATNAFLAASCEATAETV